MNGCRTQRGATFFFTPRDIFFTPRFLICLPQLVFFFAVELILNAVIFSVELILNAVLPQLMEAHSGGRRVRREFLASIVAASKRHAKKRCVAKRRACKQEQRTAEQAESNDRLREPSALVVLQYALGAPGAFLPDAVFHRKYTPPLSFFDAAVKEKKARIGALSEGARGRHVRHQDLTAPAAAACVVAARGGGRRRRGRRRRAGERGGARACAFTDARRPFGEWCHLEGRRRDRGRRHRGGQRGRGRRHRGGQRSRGRRLCG